MSCRGTCQLRHKTQQIQKRTNCTNKSNIRDLELKIHASGFKLRCASFLFFILLGNAVKWLVLAGPQQIFGRKKEVGLETGPYSNSRAVNRSILRRISKPTKWSYGFPQMTRFLTQNQPTRNRPILFCKPHFLNFL